MTRSLIWKKKFESLNSTCKSSWADCNRIMFGRFAAFLVINRKPHKKAGISWFEEFYTFHIPPCRLAQKISPLSELFSFFRQLLTRTSLGFCIFNPAGIINNTRMPIIKKPSFNACKLLSSVDIPAANKCALRTSK